MSRERELLERTIEEWDSDRDLYEFHKVIEEIRDFLSTPEPEQDEEPVAWMYPDDLERFETNETFAQAYSIKCGSPSQGTTEPLYRHPAPRPEFVRLSEEELRSCFTETNEAEPLAEGWPGLERFARAIEDALEEKNTINKSDPDSVDLQSRCRGDKP